MAAFTLRRVRRTDVPIVRRLVQLYIYDLGGAIFRVEPDGTFGSPGWHRQFWTRADRHHFVLRVRGRPAGFALVRELQARGGPAHEMAEFFVLRRYRRRGIGTRAASALFARFPGRWELSVLTWNAVARPFWRRVIRRAAVGRVAERRRRRGDLMFVVYEFETVASTAARPRGGPRSRSGAAAPLRA